MNHFAIKIGFLRAQGKFSKSFIVRALTGLKNIFNFFMIKVSTRSRKIFKFFIVRVLTGPKRNFHFLCLGYSRDPRKIFKFYIDENELENFLGPP